MKSCIRSLSSRDRSEVGYRVRIILCCMIVTAMVPTLIESINEYWFYWNALQKSTDMSGFAFFLAADMNTYAQSVFNTLGVKLTACVLVAGIGSYYSTVLANGNISGWNSYLRTLPVTPVMRAKAMLCSRGMIFVLSTVGVAALSCTVGWIAIDASFAKNLLRCVIVTSLVIETADLLVNSLIVRWVLRADKKHAQNLSVLAGFIPSLILAYLLGGMCPDHLAWSDYMAEFSFDFRWALWLLVILLLNFLGCKLLIKNLKDHFE